MKRVMGKTYLSEIGIEFKNKIVSGKRIDETGINKINELAFNHSMEI